MPGERADVVVVGLGAMGSAAAYHLSRAGAGVIGIDRFSPPHRYGSSHGQTRVTRLAIAEGTACVPLVRRSHELWRELEREAGETLLVQNGGLIIGRSEGTVVEHGVANFLNATVQAARQFGIMHEVLDEPQLRERFPQFRFQGGESGYFEKEAGYVFIEACLRTQLGLAVRQGAELRLDEVVQVIGKTGGVFQITTDRGRYECDRLVLAAGPWIGDLLGGELAKKLQVYRQVLYWFRPQGPPEIFKPECLPVFIWVTDQEHDLVYGFPEIEPAGGVKVATEQYVETTHPDRRKLEVSDDEIVAMRDYVAGRIPSLAGPCVQAVSCLYTCTPDFGFIIDDHPHWPGCIVVSACSGHGFKHSAAIGEAVAQKLLTGDANLDLSPFSAARLVSETDPRS